MSDEPWIFFANACITHNTYENINPLRLVMNYCQFDP